MKTNIYLLILVFTVFFSCKKTDQILDRPDKKLNELRSQYIEQLVGAENGWIGYLFPEGGRGFTFKFEFNNSNRVLTYSALDEKKSLVPMESSYRIAADQVLSLYFDTYSFIHILSDPDDFVNGGFRGAGLISDFEFSILDFKSDTIKLKGNHNGSELILIRANKNQGKDYINKAFKFNNSLESINHFPYYYKLIKHQGKDIQFAINTDTNTISFYYDSNGFKQFTTEYAVAENGIILRNPFQLDGLTINRLYKFNLDPTEGKGSFFIEENKNLEIFNSPTPVVIDKDAARRLYLNNYQYTSPNGFTINGKIDGTNLKRFPGYVGTYFIPRRYLDPLDAVYITFLYGASYVGPLFNTSYNIDGKIVFKEFMPVTGFDPEDNLATLEEFNKVWFDPAGFYAYQTGTNFYDMVSIKDGKTWIRLN
jgi:hypothetical protein